LLKVTFIRQPASVSQFYRSTATVVYISTLQYSTYNVCW